jgi:phosphotransferase system enzyme I (PtsI)
VQVLLPLLVHSHEVTQALRYVALAREQVAQTRSYTLPPVVTGGMIEVPAAALTAGHFARQLDFLSIGTNDLVQYTLAIDRSDHTVATLLRSVSSGCPAADCADATGVCPTEHPGGGLW